MQRIIALLIVGALGWYGYSKYQGYVSRAGERPSQSRSSDSVATQAARPEALATTSFQCDGRVYCSQMTSCAEAKYFLKNCPGVKMDGDNDGIPCERQWCK
jgi:hypothetical protein